VPSRRSCPGGADAALTPDGRVAPTPGHAVLVVMLAAWLVPRPAHAQPMDVVVLDNGDRITGEVKKLLSGRLEFKTDKADTIQIKWDAVARLTSTNFFEVILDDAHKLYGALEAPGADGTLRVAAPTGPVDVSLERVAAIERIRQSFWSRLKGSIDLGMSYTSAEERTDWNFKATTSYRTPRWRSSLSAESLYRRSDTSSFDREDLSASLQRLYSGRWLAAVFASGQRNSELALDLRLIAGGGAGFHIVRTVEQDLIALAGLAVSRERFLDDRSDTNSLEAVVGLSYDLYALGGRSFTVTADLAAFPSLTESGRFRLEAGVDIRKELFKDFYLSLRGADSFDNRAEGSEAAKNDFSLTTSIGWSF